MEQKESRLSGLIERYRILRGFSKKRIDYSDAVKEYYLEDGLAYIACNVSHFDDVTNKHSVREYEWPNKHFLEYVEDNAYYVPSEYPIVLEICGTHFSERQQAAIRQTLKDYYDLKLGDSQIDVNKIFLKEVLLFSFTILAAIILACFWMFYGENALLQETLVIVFWFFLWEWGDVVVFERREMHMKRNDTAQLASMKVIFSDRFVDIPVDEETKEEIIEEIVGN